MTEPYWNSKHDSYIKCPVKGCNHVGIIITKAHCRLEHGMTREEVHKKYGPPETVWKLNKRQIGNLKKKSQEGER